MSENLDNTNALLPININKVFEGRYTLIKPITENEINKRYISWVNDEEINRYLEVRHNKQSKNSLIEYINYLRKKNGCELFAVFTKKDCIHIGNCTITNYNTNGQGYIDYGIMLGDKNAQTMGLGAEVHIILLEYFFSDPNIFRINAGAAAINVVACRTLESLGYIKEGVIRNSILLANGERSNTNLYGLLREEWFSNRNKLKQIIDSLVISDF